MKKVFTLLALALFCLHLSAAPGQTLGGYLLNSFNDYFGVEASLLYWKTCRNNNIYAVSTDRVGENTFDSVKQRPSLGWRVKAFYSPNCSFFLEAGYTSFKAREGSTSYNATAGYFTSPVTSIKAQTKDVYLKAGGRAGYYLYSGCIGDIYAFGGAEWLYLKEKNTLSSPPIAGQVYRVNEHSRFRGVGFDAGLGAHVNLFSCLGLLAELNGVAAIGTRNSHFNASNDATFSLLFPSAQNIYPSSIICVPGIDVRLEVNYLIPFFPGTLAVGYEHHQFFDVLLLNPLFSTYFHGRALFDIQSQDLGFAGLYVAFRLNY